MSHYQQTSPSRLSPPPSTPARRSPEGLRGGGRRTATCRLPSGRTLHFRFGRTDKDMRIERLAPGVEVRRHCTGAHTAAAKIVVKDERVGTELASAVRRTRLRETYAADFSTACARRSSATICSNGWQHFLGSLRRRRDRPWHAYAVEPAKRMLDRAPHERRSDPDEERDKMDDNTASTDRIERKVIINAPRERVCARWPTPRRFGEWFGANLKGQSFTPGQRARGQLTFKGYEHVLVRHRGGAHRAAKVMSNRWHPYAVEPVVDVHHRGADARDFHAERCARKRHAADRGRVWLRQGAAASPPLAFRMNMRGWRHNWTASTLCQRVVALAGRNGEADDGLRRSAFEPSAREHLRVARRPDAIRSRRRAARGRRVLDRATDREHEHQPSGRDQAPAGAGRAGVVRDVKQDAKAWQLDPVQIEEARRTLDVIGKQWEVALEAEALWSRRRRGSG